MVTGMVTERVVLRGILDAYKADRGFAYPVEERAGLTMRVRTADEVRALVERAVYAALYGQD